MDNISGSNVKGLDGFYTELRRKYPNTFILATDQGKGSSLAQKLPRLEPRASPSPFGIQSASPSNTRSPQRWTPDSFLHKVQVQKAQRGQRQQVETPRCSGGTVIIQDKAISVPSWDRRDYHGAQSRLSFRLPSLRTQVEQNQAALKNRLNTPKEGDHDPRCNQNTTVRQSSNAKTTESWSSSESVSARASPHGQINVSAVKPDLLGTIMKELLPNKPGRLMNDLPKNSRDPLYKNGGCISDSDSGISVCTPMRVFRPKSRSPNRPPAPSEIIKKFSSKPKAANGPLKADHTVVTERRIQAVNVAESYDKDSSSKKRAINLTEKPQQRLPTPRVRFEDESEQEAESRYHERCILGKTDPVKSDLHSALGRPTQSLESIQKPGSSHQPSLPSQCEKAQAAGQQTVVLPYRRQPFPPSVAKKVLIDIPRSGHSNRATAYGETVPAWRSTNNKQIAPRLRKETASLDGITMSFPGSSVEWKRQEESAAGRVGEEDAGHGRFSHMENIDGGITEGSSTVPLRRTEWGSTGSSISDGSHEGSTGQIHPVKLDGQSVGGQPSKHLQKGGEISLYSRVKRSLHVKMRRRGHSQSESSDLLEVTPQHSSELQTDQLLHLSLSVDGKEKVALDRKSPLGGTASSTLVRAVLTNEGAPADVSRRSQQMGLTSCVGKPAAATLAPYKSPFLPKMMMQKLLKRGRDKKYLVRDPSPPPQGPRNPLQSTTSSAALRAKAKREHAQLSSQLSARQVTVYSDSSRVVELQRPEIGFQGLHLAKRSQNHNAGVYVVGLSSAFVSTLPAGILGVGDEILQINRRQAKDLSLEELNALLDESSCALLHVLPMPASP
ncbi:uncharacterized protein LOC142472018 isoform X1 [Ascaphus truei]|uniref:uncharacterized protein LOC142472018 isoform X1 n=1 Tax=Ascaphus truei TaxID=8439 RepID=UPI003F5AC2BE